MNQHNGIIIMITIIIIIIIIIPLSQVLNISF